MRRLAVVLVFALPLSAQEANLFPRFSLTGSTGPSSFDTNVRVDPETLPGGETLEGTLINLETDLGLEDERTLRRYGLQWRPFARHELSVMVFSAPREGLQQIDREITFRDEVYPVSALVASRFDLDYASATYTYWARRSERDGFGLSLGVANIALEASVTATNPIGNVTITETAETEAPVVLVGAQGRVAFTNRIHGEATIAALPSVTIEDYSGSALTGSAKLEYRPIRWLGIGASYHYFRLDVDVDAADLSGTLEMTTRGPEVFVRLAF
ncbi:MAG TPA: hypothetical protein VHW00_16990 [Thermoanaerobaculia bacterium]|nr:hypothetical protein [Thermoanaerobaculia bacterium]